MNESIWMGPEQLEQIARSLNSAKPIEAHLTPYRAYTLVGLLQLALRHPLMQDGRPSAQIAREMAIGLTGELGKIDPLIARSLEAGWDESNDMTDAEATTLYEPRADYISHAPYGPSAEDENVIIGCASLLQERSLIEGKPLILIASDRIEITDGLIADPHIDDGAQGITIAVACNGSEARTIAEEVYKVLCNMELSAYPEAQADE
jgi:hypothetical protein